MWEFGPFIPIFPSVKNDTVLSPQELRDGLAVRYNKRLLKLLGSCDGCGVAFSLDHGLNCAKGGNVIRRQNEIRDALGQLAALAYPHVTVEAVVFEPAAHNPTDTRLACDLAVRGLWSSQTEALIDCPIVILTPSPVPIALLSSPCWSPHSCHENQAPTSVQWPAGRLLAVCLLKWLRCSPRGRSYPEESGCPAGCEVGQQLQTNNVLCSAATVRCQFFGPQCIVCVGCPKQSCSSSFERLGSFAPFQSWRLLSFWILCSLMLLLLVLSYD